MKPSSKVEAKVTHQFRAKPEAVFDAWIAKEKVRQWFAPGAGEVVRVVVDPREGGMFSFMQRRGLDNVDHFGKYLEFFPPNRLAFTWQVKGTPDESKVYVDINATQEGSELTLVHELNPHWADYRDKTAAAWTKMLATMATIVESATSPEK